MRVGQAVRRYFTFFERFREEQYLAKFRDGRYELVIDHAKHGVDGTRNRAVRLFPDIVGMMHVDPNGARRAVRTVDIRFLP